MSIAEELAKKWFRSGPHADNDSRNLVADERARCVAAIDEALERAKQEVENVGRLAVVGEVGREACKLAAERIEAL